MRRAARAFLGAGVRDAIAAPAEAALARLPEPAYASALRHALATRGIQFLDLGYDIARATTPDGNEFRRVYRVRSFIWDDAMFVTRISFAERHFAQWPDPLRAIWRDVSVDVPDAPAASGTP